MNHCLKLCNLEKILNSESREGADRWCLQIVCKNPFERDLRSGLNQAEEGCGMDGRPDM
jgi:hypothetical protein